MIHLHYYGRHRQGFARRWERDEDYVTSDGQVSPNCYRRVWRCRCGKEVSRLNPYPDVWVWGG